MGLLFPDFAAEPLKEPIQVAEKIEELKHKLSQILILNRHLHKGEGPEIAEAFFQKLEAVYDLLVKDVQALFDGDPAAKSLTEIIRCYPGFYAVAAYRIANLLHRLGVGLIPRMITEFSHSKTGVDIHPAARIGERFCIDHGTGIVIGETTEDPKYNTFFASKADYGNFELKFKARLRDGIGNSGVQVRSQLIDDQKFVVAGPQVDVGKGYFGSLYGEKVGGYLLKAEGEPVKGREAEANEYVVVVKGNHITISVNGKVTIDTDFPDNKGKNPAPAAGIIAFQVHSGYPKMRAEYTDIRFQKLP